MPLTRTPVLAAWCALALAVPGVAAAQDTTGGLPPDTTAPVVSSLKVTPSKLSLTRLHAPTATFALSEAVTVTVTVERLQRGRRVKGHCLAAKHKPKAKEACTKATRISQRTSAAPAGAARIKIAVRSGARTLPASTYRVTAAAVDAAANRSTPATAHFTIAF
jgi:hypothetical protein